MKHKILLISLLIVHFADAQEKKYYDSDKNLTTNMSLATEYAITEKNTFVGDSMITKETFYYLSGAKKSESLYMNIYKHKKLKVTKNTGQWGEWFENGNIRLKSHYDNGQLQGEFSTYWLNGKQRRRDIFERGKLIEGNCYDSIGNKIPTYFPYETYPEFPGGEERLMKFLSKSIRYPTDMQVTVNGTVYTAFFVEANGRISSVKVVQSNNPNIEDEAIRVVKSMPDWIPGTREGQKARFKFILPISISAH
jgi:Periplasmic protein TonB, links inner and outer membranes